MVENGHAEPVKARNIFLPAKQDVVIREGSLVMLYLVRCTHVAQEEVKLIDMYSLGK